MYCPGTMYISQNYVCFDSKVLEKQLVIPFQNVKNISKESTSITTCILFKTQKNKKDEKEAEVEYWFGIFIGWGKIDECYLVVQSLWKQQLDRTHYQLDLQLHTSRKSKYLEIFYSKNSYNKNRDKSKSLTALPIHELSLNSSTPSILQNQPPPSLLRKNSFDGDEVLSSNIFGLKGNTGVTKRLISSQKTREYLHLFRLPSSEQLLDGYPIPSTIYIRENSHPGYLYLSNNFLCFQAQQTGESHLFFVLPFSIARDISKQNAMFGLLGNSVKINTDPSLTNPSEFLFSMSNRDKRFGEIWQVGTLSMKRSNHQMFLLQSSDLIPISPRSFVNSFSIPHPLPEFDSSSNSGDISSDQPVDNKEINELSQNESTLDSSLDSEENNNKDKEGIEQNNLRNSGEGQKGKYVSASEKIWGSMLFDLKLFQENYILKQKRQEQLWQRYIALNGSGVTMLRTQDFSIVCGRGIPDSLRSRIWLFSSGAQFKLETNKGFYQQILTQHKNDQSQAIIEIEKDLHRSFPEHPFYQTEEGISSLRNVLTAYSWKNPSVGYCQSMNIVCALLLLYLEEENCFWILSTICEDILPKYYSSAMVGSQIDQELFEKLLEKCLPAVFTHLNQISFPISVITQPWFLCLFIGFIPIEQVLRILDCLFSEGISILFKVCLAMFKLEEAKILKYNRMEQIFVLWKERKWKSSMDDVLYFALVEFADVISNKEIEEMRNSVQFKAMENVEIRSKKTLIRDLKNLSLFNESEVDSLYRKFRNVFPPNSENNNFMDFKLFVKLIDVFCPFWRGNHILIKNSFDRWDNNKDGLVDLVDITPGLSILLKGSLHQRLLCLLFYSSYQQFILIILIICQKCA